MKICCYGICKNEKKFIQRCLNSIWQADYIAILDTGSTDGTYEELLKLQKENPEKIFISQKEFKPWRFDSARNASMELIPNDTTVCISVDMDDVFPENWRAIVEKDIEAGYNKIICRYQYYNEDGSQPGGRTLLDRISKYGEAHWENGIHERLVVENENVIDEPDFVVDHRQDLNKERRQIYLEAAEASAEDSDYGKLCLGYEYNNAGYPEKAIETFENLYEKLKDTNSEFITRKVMLLLSEIYGKFGNVEKEVDTIRRMLEITEKNSRFEDSPNFSLDFEAKYSEILKNYDEQFMSYYNMATESFAKQEYLKAVSYIDICKALCKLQSVFTIRQQYIDVYLAMIDKKTYTENKVAVYAMCKNESAFVERWYDSMKEADYIIVLDTGSTDDTYNKLIELSKKDSRVIVGQQVFKPWRFDVPRNIAMAMIPEDANILLSTDLDEILEAGWADDLKSHWIEGKHERANYQYAWSHNSSGENGRVFWYNKVHNWKWIWKYPVHELLYNVETNSEHYSHSCGVSLTKMFLHHYPDQTKSRGNYLPLLEQRAEEDADDFYGLVYLAHEYNYRGRYQDSINLFAKILKKPDINNDSVLKACSYLFIGEDYIALNNIPQAIVNYLLAIKADPTYREAYLNLAQIYLNENNYDLAIYYIKSALKNSVRHFSWLERDTSWSYQPYDMLSLAYYYSGDKIRSLAAAIRAAELDPENPRLQENIKLIKENITDKDWSL